MAQFEPSLLITDEHFETVPLPSITNLCSPTTTDRSTRSILPKGVALKIALTEQHADGTFAYSFLCSRVMERIQIASCVLSHILRNPSVIVGNREAVINTGPRCLLFSVDYSMLVLNQKRGEHSPYESVAHCHSPGEKAAG